jgi:hypothetical protein
MIEYIKDRWLTWRTGKDKYQREWEAWYDTNVVWRADTIPNMFMHFEYVMELNWNKFFDYAEPFAWIPCEDASQYFYPTRELGNNAVWRIERVMWDKWDNCWRINEIGGEDRVFVATNNSKDAMMMALKYS